MDNGSHQAFQILRLGFTVAPIIAGLDKFLQLLTNWDKYLAPAVPATLGIAPHTFMMLVGVIEIVAGLLVAVKPRFGGYLVSAWLVGIIVNLLLVGGYLDVALRDLGLAMGAFALARLAEADERIRVATPARA
jgi:uncharacterized membrane protein YphA (DoxX/SURF4 family)